MQKNMKNKFHSLCKTNNRKSLYTVLHLEMYCSVNGLIEVRKKESMTWFWSHKEQFQKSSLSFYELNY